MSPHISDISRERPFEIALLLGAILFILCLQVFLLVNFNINWDEFHYLSIIFEHSRGTLSKSLQTFHVHFFTWITQLGWDEVQLILLSRTFMLCCELSTLGFIFLISRRFVSIKFALIGVVSYLASGFVLMYGTNFRSDPIITALLMASIYLLMDRSNYLWRCLAASITVALAIVISIKSVLYIPPLIGALVWGMRSMEGIKNKLVICFGLALSVSITTLMFYLWHRSTLSPGAADAAGAAGAAGAADAFSKLDSIFSKMLIDVPFWPQKKYFLSWAIASWPQMLLVLAGFYLLQTRHKAQSSVLLKVSVLFTLPILSIFFYRNAYPYFFPFIVAPLMIVVSIGAQEVSQNVSRLFARSSISILVIYMVICTLGHAFLYSFHNQISQREIIATIHTIFPEPTPYIDRNSMISSYPKCGFFMSKWGIENYRRKGKPIFAQVLEECEPKFLIINSRQLVSVMIRRPPKDPLLSLFDQDAKVLRANFIHHWGYIWVAGKSFGPGISAIKFNIAIEGTYTVESPQPVTINGQQYKGGDYIFLSRGSHTINSASHWTNLRFGRRLPRPDFTPTKPIYFSFLWDRKYMVK